MFFLNCLKVFRKPKKNLGNTKNTNDNQRTPTKHLRENNKNKVLKGFRPTLGYVCRCRFSRRFLFVVFGFLLYFWFSQMFVWFSKNLRENQQTTNKNKPISKGRSETFKNFVCFVFPKVCLVFFGVLLYCLFSLRCCWCSKKTFGKTNKTNKTNPYPRVGLKPLNNFVFWFSRRFVLFSLVFFCIF